MATEMRVPPVGESITEVTIGSWAKSNGDYVEKDEIICELESDKATFELNAEVAGILTIEAEEGDTLAIDDLICKIEEGEKPADSSSGSDKADSGKDGKPAPSHSNQGYEKEENKAPVAAEDKKSGGYAEGHPSPAAAKTMAEKGLSSNDVKGSGRDGRITKEDAQNAQKPAPQPAKSADKPAAAPKPAGGSRDTERKRMSSLRKTIARRLVQVKNETAMLTTFNEVDMKPMMDLRSRYKDEFLKRHDVKLGFMSFFVKACCTALLEFPNVNAQLDNEEVIHHHYCDISIAVSTPKGLVVPVLRNAEQLSFAGVEGGIGELAIKARDGKLSIEEMQGGTFTITNGGVFGSMLSTPIINAPQTAILGMHNIIERPVAINGQVEIRPMMYVALSYDHRIIDGKDSVGFLVRVKQLLEDPGRMLLEV